MKQKIKLAISIILMLCLSNHWASAQFQQVLFSSNGSWRTQANPPVGRIGVGTFPNGTNLPSVLTVNSNLVPSPTGEVFRTDCPIGETPYWRMLRGGTEYGNLFNNTESNDFCVKATQGNLNLESPKGKVIVQSQLVLKATDADNYFLITVNSKGELTVIPIDKEILFAKK